MMLSPPPSSKILGTKDMMPPPFLPLFTKPQGSGPLFVLITCLAVDLLALLLSLGLLMDPDL